MALLTTVLTVRCSTFVPHYPVLFKMGMSPTQRRLFLCALTIGWVANSYLLGNEAERRRGEGGEGNGGSGGMAGGK